MKQSSSPPLSSSALIDYNYSDKGNQIGDEGAFAIAEMLKSPNCNLIQLHIVVCTYNSVIKDRSIKN